MWMSQNTQPFLYLVWMMVKFQSNFYNQPTAVRVVCWDTISLPLQKIVWLFIKNRPQDIHDCHLSLGFHNSEFEYIIY